MNWINGDWVDSQKRTKSFDPAISQEIGTYADASHADVAVVIRAAVRAFAESDWKDNRHLRARVVNQLADRFETRREDLIEILTLENGNVKPEAAFDVDMIPSKFRYWASVALTNYGWAMEVAPGRLSFVTWSAIGVQG
jgi:acyl-CoA reductase-like NAD-dependent aldehyde dehydrogenase